MKPIVSASLLALALLSGCATARVQSDPIAAPPTEEIVLDPTLVRAKIQDGQPVQAEVIDSAELFQRAQRSFKKQQWDDALRDYSALVKDFPESQYYLASLYNSALCLDNLSKWEEAIALYQRVVEEFPGREAATDAMYRTVWCESQRGRHDEVLALVQRILDRSGLAPYDRVEALVRRGDALLALGRLEEAEDAYREALQAHERAPKENAVPEDSHFVVAARFGLSQVYHRLFRAVRFKLPPETMERDLEKKVALFQQAQSSYIRTMKMGNPHWATAAGYEIGQMYEQFYADLLNSEIPALQQDEARVYFDELRGKLRPLMERALQIYEKNITLSERAGVDNDFTRRTQESLERLKRYITDDSLQGEDEERIRKGIFVDQVGQPTPTDPRANPTDAPADERPESTRPTHSPPSAAR
jgi:tetratricopeptide (TPR) repeat protein